MRLVCPNCDAEYEVDDSLVPPEGRDVQCSNCTTTWFQAGSDAKTEPQPEPDAPQDPPADDAAPEADFDTDAAAIAAVASAAAAADAPKPRKPSVDPEAMKVIHEEVERETAARIAERGGIETQPDLGLDDTDTEERASAARDRMARRRGIAPEADKVEDTGEKLSAAPKREEPTDKKELFPDIEEINSTLSPETAEAEAEAARMSDQGGVLPAQQGSSSSFRIGFGMMLLVIVAMLLLYVYAPQISQSSPGLAGTLESYVSTVDAGRVKLDTMVQGLVDRIGATLSEQSSNR